MATIVDEVSSLPLLEPLSKATGRMMSKISVFANDFLLVDLDRDGTRFICTAVTMRGLETDEPGTDVIEHCGMRYETTSAPPSYGIREEVFARMPECKRISKRPDHFEWVIAATDVNALVLHHSLPSLRLVFQSEDARIYYLFLLRRFLLQAESCHIIANYKINGIIPEMPTDFIEHPERPLLPYQRVGLLACLHREAFGLFMEQGTGKTPVAINRICLEGARKRAGLLPNRPGVKRQYNALILCPNQVRTNWEREFENFATVPGKVSVLRGGVTGRARCLVDTVRDEADCAWSASICSLDSTDSMIEFFKRVDFDLVVVDESHLIKSSKAKRSIAVHTLRKFPLCRQAMVLTGTPIANSVMDLWSQFEAMAEGMSGFRRYENYRRFYGVFRKTDGQEGRGVEKLLGIKNMPLIQERLARTAFLITKKEARLNLPDKMWDIYEVQMTPKQAEIYTMMAKQLAVTLGDIDEKTMSADHVLTMLLRLAQITSGHVKWDRRVDPMTMEMVNEAVVEQIDAVNPKIEACIEMLRDEGRDPNGKTIIWCAFVEDIRALQRKLTAEGIGHRVYYGSVSAADREEAVLSFNSDPNVTVFVANPATAGEGLNLVGYDWWNKEPSQTTYTDHEVFFSCDWSATKRSQAEDRAHRKGTRQPVRITDLCIPGTIDEEIRARVLTKRQNAMTIQDVREIMKRVLNFHQEADD